MAGRRNLVALVLGAMVVAAVAVVAESVVYEVQQVPIQRLARNLEALIAKDPKNVQVRVNLARTHAMAYALKKSEVPIAKGQESQGAHFGWGKFEAIPFENKNTGSARERQAAQEQLVTAIAKYEEALAIGPRDLVANLGYAWCLAQSGDKAPAVTAYRKTIEIAWETEQKSRNAMAGTVSITEEAATYLIPLLDRTADAAEIARLRERIKVINANTRRWITPIAIPLETGLTADDLRSTATVMFDADGSGVARRWTWITPCAAWLVSDIHKSGHITSSLQLFGNVTWWMFWQNGYEPLRALDDNGDGRISGRELEGLSLWRDANINGISEPGEVKPVTAWKILSLSYSFEIDPLDQDEILFSRAGVAFTDGTSRRTYDLILHRLASASK